MIDVKIVCEKDKYKPSYANSTDACMDLKVKVEEGKSLIAPYTSKSFSTGIKVQVPEDHVMLIFPRSSTGFKLHCMLSNTTGIIDAGYRDEVRLALYNFGDSAVELEDGQRVAQMMIIPRPKINLIEVDDDEDFKKGNRGGGIGSTGK